MQKSKKSGLPEYIKMRHDDHYVDLIASRSYSPRIRMLSLDIIEPSAHQARMELGSMQELMDSIKEKGILEPVLVRRKNDKYEIIAGERRYIAAKNIKMSEIPCIEMNVSDNEAMELALIENMQRKDLDIFEEADGLKVLIDLYGYSHEQISKKIGKARSTVTEIINIGRIPKEIRKLCDEYGITSRSTVIEIAKQKSKEDMYRLVTEIKRRELKREDTRELSRKIKGKVQKEKGFVYRYEGKDKKFKLKIEFMRGEVSSEEIIEILEDIIYKLKEK